MIVDITPLNYGKQTIEIDDLINIPKEYLQKSEIIDVKEIKVKGYIKWQYDNLFLYLDIKGTMILPSTRTLKPTDYSFHTEISSNIEEKDKKTPKTIDILPIIWENILMEIPIRIVNPSEKIIKKGDGWELITDNEEV